MPEDRVAQELLEDIGGTDVPERAGSGGKAATPRGGRQARRSDGELTRARVLQAAVDCILERGYYQSSSNAIARQADVTWGTLQHQFGSREALLLEVIEEGWAKLRGTLEAAEVSGETLEQRLHSMLEILEVYYGRADQLAHIQIMLDLSNDPETSEATRKALAAHARALSRAWKPFFEQAMGEAGHNAELVEYAFLTLRGFLEANLLTLKFRPVGRKSSIRDLLVRGVAVAIEERAAELGISTDRAADGVSTRRRASAKTRAAGG